MPAIGTPPTNTDDVAARLQAAVGDAYVIGHEMGAGGTNRLFLARERVLDREVVIKVLSPVSSSEIASERFRREMAIAAHLQHPHILPILAAGSGEGLLYYVMPRATGESLRQRVTREFRLSVGDAARIMAELCDAVQHAHRMGILHRDIKPENVLLDGSGEHVQLSDFGIARAFGTESLNRITPTGAPVGSSGYMAPEQLLEPEKVDERSDIYALGIVAYEILAGERPFKSDAHALSSGPLVAEPPKLAAVRRDIPRAVSEVVYRAMSRDPARRYRSARDFGQAMTRAAVPVEVKRRNLMFAGVAVVAVAIVVLLALRTSRLHGIDGNTIAVAPFQVRDERYAIWGEGLADVLSANLDGVGTLRSVPATVAVHQWDGGGDHDAAAQFGRRVGARFTLYGRLAPAGRDSVRVTASVVDVVSGRSIVNIEFNDHAERMDRVADSLTVAVMRDVGEMQPSAAPRARAFGSGSLPALREFLRGEHFFRLAYWDSASTHYQRAVALDPTLAVGWSRLTAIARWSNALPADTSYVSLASRNGGAVAPRERILMQVDSLVLEIQRVAGNQPLLRLRQLVDSLVLVAPRDPYLWTIIGEQRTSHLREFGATSADALEAFAQAIRLDSAFAVPFVMAFAEALDIGGLDAALPYAEGVLRAAPLGDDAAAMKVIVAAARSGMSAPDVTDASPVLLERAARHLYSYGDSTRLGLQLARAAVRPGERPPGEQLLRGVLFHGGIRETAGLSNGEAQLRTLIWAEGATGARRYVEAWRDSPSLPSFAWPIDVAMDAAAGERDTATISLARGQIDRLAQRASSSDAGYWQFLKQASEAYAALARADTSRAIQLLSTLPDSSCYLRCVMPRLSLARLLNDTRQAQRADSLFARGDGLFGWSRGSERLIERGLWTFERARAAELRGKKDAAIADYRRVAWVWSEAEPELRRYAEAARAAISRLR